jgi:hypothetical protein
VDHGCALTDEEKERFEEFDVMAALCESVVGDMTIFPGSACTRITNRVAERESGRTRTLEQYLPDSGSVGELQLAIRLQF